MSSGKIRVLQLLPGLRTGRVGRMVLELCRELKQGPWDIEPEVLAFDHPESSDSRESKGSNGYDEGLARLFRSSGIPVTLLEKGSRFSLSLVVELATRTRKSQIPLIHSHELEALIYGSLARRLRPSGLALIHTQHTLRQLKGGTGQRISQRVYARLADRIVAISEPVASAYAGLLGRKPEVIENGVPLAIPPLIGREFRFEKRKELIETLQSEETKLGLHSALERRWALCLSRVCEAKGQIELVDLWSRLPHERTSDSMLLIVGPIEEEAYYSKLKSRIDGLPEPIRRTIAVCGPTSEPERWLSASDLLVSASRFEGIPLAALEAAGAGNALFLSDIPGHSVFFPEAVSFSLEQLEDGASRLSALLARQGEPDEVLRLERVAQDVRARFSSRAMAAKYAAVYQTLASGTLDFNHRITGSKRT